jgi:Bacterial PH domain
MIEPNAELNEPGLAKALAEMQSILIPGESVEAWATQRRIFALSHRRTLIAATSGRLIWLVRKLLGGFDVVNLRWQDLSEVSLKVGILGADLVIRADQVTDLAIQAQHGARVITIAGLRKEQAQAVYRICQAQDQAWREKRRIRELEELRARSGGVQLNTSGLSGAAPAAAAGGTSESVRRLQEAKQMLDSRLITDSEYESIKARILAGG